MSMIFSSVLQIPSLTTASDGSLQLFQKKKTFDSLLDLENERKNQPVWLLSKDVLACTLSF